MQAGQLSVWAEFELEFLTPLEPSELFGFLVAGQDLVDQGRRQPNLFEESGERVAFGNYDLMVARVFLFFDRRLRLGGRGRVFSVVFDLREGEAAASFVAWTASAAS